MKLVIVYRYDMDRFYEIGSFPPGDVEEVISLIRKYGVIFEENKTEQMYLDQAVFNVTTKQMALIVGPKKGG